MPCWKVNQKDLKSFGRMKGHFQPHLARKINFKLIYRETATYYILKKPLKIT